MKSLVVYYSYSGNTKLLAEKIAEYTNSDIKEIIAKVPYTDEDVDWTKEDSRTTLEYKDRTIRPEINDIDITGYDAIYIGFPVWFYREPNLIDTFIESHNFDGKTVRFFASSHSSSLESFIDKIIGDYPFIKDGYRAGYNLDDEEIKNWINKIN